MEEHDQKMFFAGMALVGLVQKGVDPSSAAELAWQFADHMYEQRPRGDKPEWML